MRARGIFVKDSFHSSDSFHGYFIQTALTTNVAVTDHPRLFKPKNRLLTIKKKKKEFQLSYRPCVCEASFRDLFGIAWCIGCECGLNDLETNTIYNYNKTIFMVYTF